MSSYSSSSAESIKDEMEISWWQRRSRMEKKLTLFSVTALLTIFVLMLVLIIFSVCASPTCLSPNCLLTANEFLEYVDVSVNPCNDFYRFTCGNFLDSVQLDGKSHKSVELSIRDNIDSGMQEILEQAEDLHDSEPIILARNLYKSCVHQNAFQEEQVKVIKGALQRIGGWPALDGDGWLTHKFEWTAATLKLRELGFDFEFFFRLHVGVDEQDPSKHILQLHPPFNLLAGMNENEKNLFYNKMVNLSTAFGAERHRVRYEFRQVMDFMENLFLVKQLSHYASSVLLDLHPQSSKREEDAEKYEYLTIFELQHRFRNITWLEYINSILLPVSSVSYENIVAVYNVSYFSRLRGLLRRTRKRILANYIGWSVLRENYPFVTQDLPVSETWKYSPNDLLELQRKHCMKLTRSRFPLTLQSSYFYNYFSKEAKEHVALIVNNIKEQLVEVLTALQWMDEETRRKSLERLSSSVIEVGFPEDLINPEKVDTLTAEDTSDQHNFLKLLLRVDRHLKDLHFEKLHRPVQQSLYSTEKFAIGAGVSYSADSNSLTVPVGFLQGVIYGRQRPQYLNYGALGSAVGHELFHAIFASESYEVTKDHSWLSTEASLKLNEKFSCAVRHYGQYFVTEIMQHLNSSNTKYEDMADIFGAKLAYDAYIRWTSSNGLEQTLPGFNNTPKQLFWVSYAIRFCEKTTPNALNESVARNITSPGRFRVLGITRNLEEFSRDFNCPPKSLEKCTI